MDVTVPPEETNAAMQRIHKEYVSYEDREPRWSTSLLIAFNVIVYSSKYSSVKFRSKRGIALVQLSSKYLEHLRCHYSL